LEVFYFHTEFLSRFSRTRHLFFQQNRPQM